ncbi:unnamed protein product [Psylliodes chrysocephalus]|uniref:Thioredoxin domain-containing protein n=1 Tax=Psylliodes chrysocephalus TaxID=3402493 RepID=A0A9P0CLA5_9CUCU|nr:unnamed protein product [Psylliodes chrysocephala]
MFLSILIISFIGFFGQSHSSYLELSDNFSELKKNGGHWLIKFYAPWCGHCQRLEPVWAQVGEALIHTNVKVGRIDCSHFPKIASEFGIRGYPTIKFITTDSEHTFTGDRNKDDIIQFVSRVAGPPVRELATAKDFTEIKQSRRVFFAFIGDKSGEFWETYFDVAKRFQPFSHFYVLKEEVAKQLLTVPLVPSLFVYQDNEPSYFSASDSKVIDDPSLNASMSKWVNEERFGTYLKVSRGNLNDLMHLNRYVVLAIVDEKYLHEPDMAKFKDMIGNIIKTNKRKYRKRFIFGWVGNPEFANSIALDVVPLPYLLVINSTNHYHHVPDVEDCSKMTARDVELFLETIYNQSAFAYGGNGYGTRLYRAYFEAKTAVIEMWQGNPILTAILFTIPVLFIIFIFYSLCFADILDNDGIEEDEDDEDAEEEALIESHLKSE